MSYVDYAGLVAFILIGGIAVGLSAGSIIRTLVQANMSTLPQSEPASQPLPFFGCPEDACAVHQFANTDYYRHMLAALENALHQEGYELSRAPEHQVVLPRGVRKRIARHVFMARDKYLAPQQRDSTIAEKAALSEEDGFSGQWLDILLKGCASQGWIIAPRSAWAAQAYPLRQVEIIVRMVAPSVTRDAVRCLSELARMVRDDPFPDTLAGSRQSKTVDDTLRYDVTRMLCDHAPGWFPDAAGTALPADIASGHALPSYLSPSRYFIVRAQGTRHTTQAFLAAGIEQAAERIGAGEHQGAQYDDDAGYAFFVSSPATDD
ncbi:hypothetical protein ACI2I2_19945 [Scandinavium sp. NPDC088450]|uniref:hypothetical protein n=1 Tax=Scandinavium sp. NPDC088450 TaxID=3364514 RepID=UPI00384C44C3